MASGCNTAQNVQKGRFAHVTNYAVNKKNTAYVPRWDQRGLQMLDQLSV